MSCVARFSALTVAILLTTACGGDMAAPQPTVYFSLDAPLCGSVLPMRFYIDSVQVGTDTFRINAGPPNHTASIGYHVTAGVHRLGAQASLGGAFSYTWPDTLVTLSAGNVFVRSLPFYCS